MISEAAPTVALYALLTDGEGYRYIGVTKRALTRRLKEHWDDVRKGGRTRKCRWMRKRAGEGREVKIVELARAPESEWAHWERAFIARAKLYHDLTNSSAGGLGLFNPSADARDRMSAAKKGRSLSEETKRKLSVALTGRVRSAAHRANLSASGKHRRVPEHVREILRAANLGKKQSAEAVAKRAASNTGKKRSPETCARISAGNRGKPRSAACKLKLSLHNKGKTHTAESRLRMSAALKGRVFSDEHRKNMAAAIKTSWVQRRIKYANRNTDKT